MAIVKMKKVSFEDEKEIKHIKKTKYYPSKSNKNVIYVPQSLISSFELEANKGNMSFSINEIDEKDDVKIIFKNGWFSSVFAEFLTEKDMPGYYDVDPTKYYAICFCILFGIMFGDIGQGLVLLVLGLIFKQNKKLALLLRASIFSIIFGWLYGSIFGNEEIIPEFMEAHGLEYWRFGLLEKANTESLLLIVGFVGAIMILVGIIIDIISKLRKHEKRIAIYSRKGIAGLIYYSCIIHFGFTLYNNHFMALTNFIPLVCLIVSIVLLYFYEENKKERLAYLWETVLKFASSTMAFLMVGCFALAHATLMYVVYKIAQNLETIKIVIIILGNILVMGIEATEVFHKCLELEMHILHSFFAEKEQEEE